MLLAACEPPEYDLAIKNVTVVDAVSGARSNQTVLTRADTIAAIIPSGESARALQVVDGTGGYLIPGLWDFHVHLTYDDADADEMARLFLDYGVTSVRDTGGRLDLIQPVVERLEDSDEAPRVFFAGPLQDGRDVVYDGESRPEIGISNPDPGAAVANVGLLAAAGVDFIKVYELVSPEVFGALIAAARANNLPIAGHVPLSMLASEAGPQLGSMEHLRNVELDCAANYQELLDARLTALTNPDGLPGGDLRSSLHTAQRMPAVQAVDADRCSEVVASLRGTIQVPTLRLNALSVQPPYGRPDWPDALTRLGGEQAEAYRTLGESRLASTDETDTTFGHWSLHLTGLMQGAGVPIGAGTDTPIGLAIPGYSLHNELSMLVRAGLDPVDALRAATVRPAEFFGLSGEMGQVATGMRADLVLLGGNPLEDIDNTRSIRMVISKGHIVRQWD